MIIVIISIVISAIIYALASLLSNKKSELNTALQQSKILQKTISEQSAQIELLVEKNNTLSSRVDSYEMDLKEIFSNRNDAFSYVSVLMSDYLLIDYERSINYLENKTRPAIKEALRIRELQYKTRDYLSELYKIRYTLNYLYSLYPDLKSVLEVDAEEESQLDTADVSAVDVSDKELWNSLNDIQKSQFKLDNYIKRSKSKWEIGRDYELYVGYVYSKSGYTVDYCGSYLKLEDLGRDLIVSRNGEVGIIQCKYWSNIKQIHEKHIAQLYGTVISYIIENNALPDLVHGILITNITLSDTAKKFASYLGIKYKESFPMGDFPRIKCNINRDKDGFVTKIYHLPTDQQYDNVKINGKGECFVFTAEEAENLGFRHAFKWHSQ